MQGLGPVRHALVSSFACAAAFTASPCLSGNTERAWDVTNTGQPYRDITFTTTEGTWMSVDISPDGKSLVFDLLGSIYQIPSTGGDAKLIHGGPAMQRTPSFSPDGRKLLYISDASGAENAWLSNPDGSNAQQITHETANLLMSIAWAGDGESVVGEYIEGRYPARFTSDLRLFDLLGGVRTIVPTPPNRRDVAEPALSRDGRYIYYTERLAPTFQIYVDANHINYAVKRSDLQTGAVEEMASSWGGGFDPQISRDGRRLAFVRRVENKTVLFVLELATNEQRAIYDGLDRDLQASYEAQANYYPHFGWFPDNRHVAIWGKGRLYRVDMDSGRATEIPFRVAVHQRITDPVRVEHDLEPHKFTVRAIRSLAASPNGHTLTFTGLAHLWRKELPAGVPVRLSPGAAFSFEPAYSNDGRRLVYVEWDDERGSALRIASETGSGARTLVSSPGVIRQPCFSPDGSRVVYRIQEADTSMGGGGWAKPGIYWVSASGGGSHFVADGDDAPRFSPDGERIYYVRTDYSGESPAQVLQSDTLDGLDRREHARTPDADASELRPSPDFHWIAFRERQQYYVAPYVDTGSSMLISARTKEISVRKLTNQGGYGLVWSADSSTLHWLLGPRLYRTRVNDSESPVVSYASVGLEAESDVPKGSLAFTHARMITMRGDEVINDGTVVVTDNRITAVGASGTVSIPPGAKVVDVTGKTVMPGLIDAHGHIDCCFGEGVSPQKQPTRYAALAFGVTMNFDPYPNDLTSYESTETTIAGLTVGPRWMGTGSAIWGRSHQNSHFYVPIESLQDAENLMAHKAAVGGIIIKSYRYPQRQARQMLIAAGRKAGIMVDVEGESQFYNNITEILDGHTNLEHSLPVATYYDDLVQLMSRAKLHNTPTLIVLFGELFGENYMYQTTEVWKDPKIRAYVQETLSGYSPLLTPYGAPPYARAMTTIQAADELWNIGFRSLARSVKKLDDAGVVINVGSHGEIAGLAMHWEMALLSQGGMSNMRILHAATVNTANTLGVERQIGSLEVGKLADLIVLDRNPLEDIHNTNSVRYTMVNGRLYDSLSMDEIGNYSRPRGHFYWELQPRNGIDWNEAWGGR